MFVEQSFKNDYPGPGQYNVPAKDRNNQIGLSSHFAKAVGRDFANIEKLKIMIDKSLPTNDARESYIKPSMSQ